MSALTKEEAVTRLIRSKFKSSVSFVKERIKTRVRVAIFVGARLFRVLLD